MAKDIKLLIVDDEASFRLLLRTFFEQKGYAVTAVESAEHAIDMMRKEPQQIALIDLQLPGASGVELVKKLRECYPLGAYFAMTGYSSLFELTDVREAGFDDYFVKPLKLHELLHAVEEACRRSKRWRRKDTVADQ